MPWSQLLSVITSSGPDARLVASAEGDLDCVAWASRETPNVRSVERGKAGPVGDRHLKTPERSAGYPIYKNTRNVTPPTRGV